MIPIIQTNRLRIAIDFEVLFVSLMFWEIFLIPLFSKPKLEKLECKFKVVCSKPEIPIPNGPINTAINLVRMIEIKMLNIWTPPNNTVDLNICEYVVLGFDNLV